MKKNKTKQKRKRFGCVCGFFSEVRALKDDNLKSETIYKDSGCQITSD